MTDPRCRRRGKAFLFRAGADKKGKEKDGASEVIACAREWGYVSTISRITVRNW